MIESFEDYYDAIDFLQTELLFLNGEATITLRRVNNMWQAGVFNQQMEFKFDGHTDE